MLKEVKSSSEQELTNKQIDLQSQSDQIDNQVASDIGPTIVFCNPNAGYYEYMYYEVRNAGNTITTTRANGLSSTRRRASISSCGTTGATAKAKDPLTPM
jgi:hypothetical protein